MLINYTVVFILKNKYRNNFDAQFFDKMGHKFNAPQPMVHIKTGLPVHPSHSILLCTPIKMAYVASSVYTPLCMAYDSDF